jgi:membrane-bound metal-dependent hydrolase YbcI (DUF457 family)
MTFLDNITHTLVGLTLSRTPLERAGRGTTAALIVASNIPDIDVVMALSGGRAAYLADHRAFTHSIFGTVVLALASAGLALAWQRRRDRQDAETARSAPASFAALAGVSLVGTICHVLLDLATPYGTRLFSPVSSIWYSTDWMPIIDIYLLAILLGGTLAFLVRPERRRAIAAGIIVASLGYYAVRATARQAALREAGAELAAGGIQACTPDADPARASWLELRRWPEGSAGESAPAGATPDDPCLVETAAIPTFLSPFIWRIVARYPDAYDLSEIDVRPAWLGGHAETTIRSIRYPNARAPVVDQAAAAYPAQVFLRFARFPLAHVAPDGAHTVVSWSDLRFMGGLTSLTPARSRPSAFRVTVTLDARGTILSAGFGT